MDQDNMKLLENFLGSFQRVRVDFKFFIRNFTKLPAKLRTQENHINFDPSPYTMLSKDLPEILLTLVASFMGYEPLIKELVRAASWEDFKTRYQACKKFQFIDTPLTLAIMMRHNRITKLLLEKRDYEIQAGNHFSVLDIASSWGNFQVVKSLLRKAGVICSDRGLKTPPQPSKFEADND